MNLSLRERQSSRKYIVPLPPVPSSPLGHSTKRPLGTAPLPYGETREATLRPGVRFKKTASSLRIIATKGNATLAAGLTYPKIHNPDLELYLQLKKKEHDFAEAIVPAVSPFQYIPSSARDAELSAASARLYLPQATSTSKDAPIDLKFDTFTSWFQDMKLKIHMRVVQSQQMKADVSPLEEQLEPQLSMTSPARSKKEEKKNKKNIYDAIDMTPPMQPTSPKNNKDNNGSDTKRQRKKSILNMKEMLPSARGKERARAAAWEASRESWFAESTPHSNPGTPKGRLARSSSFSLSQSSSTPHTYIPSVPTDSPSTPLRPRARTQAPPLLKTTPQPPPPSSHGSSMSSMSSMLSSSSSSPSSLTPSPTANTSPLSYNSSTIATATTTAATSTTTTTPHNNPQLSQPVFLARGKKVHSEYDMRKIRFKARMDGINE